MLGMFSLNAAGLRKDYWEGKLTYSSHNVVHH